MLKICLLNLTTNILLRAYNISLVNTSVNNKIFFQPTVYNFIKHYCSKYIYFIHNKYRAHSYKKFLYFQKQRSSL